MTEETKELYNALKEATTLSCELCHERGHYSYDYEGDFDIENLIKDGCPAPFWYVSVCPARKWLKILSEVKEGK